MLDGSYFIGSGHRTSDGTLHFGALNGLTSFHPIAIHSNTSPPQVVITDFLIFNQSILNDPKHSDLNLFGSIQKAIPIQLRHNDSIFSFEFAALHYADPQRNRYVFQ